MSKLPQQRASKLDDWKWLVSGAADELIGMLSERPGSVISWTRQLRKQGLSPPRIRLLIDQLTLRPLAEKKFTRAARMFFSRKLLEQATDERLANYKASRFKACDCVVDFCCGLGGDLVSLASRKPATGVDSSPMACLLAQANCLANDVQADLAVANAEEFPIDPAAWIHVDPDRRVEGHRTTTLDYFSPGPDFLQRLVTQQENVVIKLAPATKLPGQWSNCQRQWLGDRYECKQQILWFGETAQFAGAKTATVINRDGSILFEWVEGSSGRCELACEFGHFLYEPHSTIIAGRMIDSLANQLGLKRIAADIQYLTGQAANYAGLTRFGVLETCRIDERDIRDSLRRHDCGYLEIKKRGVDHGLLKRFAKLDLQGSQQRVLVLTRLGDRHIAVICERLDTDSSIQ